MRANHRLPAAVSPALLVLALLLHLVPALAQRVAGDPTRPERLAAAGSWGFQLQNLDLAKLRAAPHDVLVIDYSKNAGEDGAFTPADLAILRAKPDGSRRIVLAYLSIGEAETYRYYWRWTWDGSWYGRLLGIFLAPAWLGPENPEWRGNYAVRYWQDGWQRIILGDGGYLDRIVAAGFDGVYLDKVDSSLEPIAAGRISARDDMRTFVRRIAERGRARSPGFLIVPQNGEDLLDDPAYVALVDGIGKEDLFFGELKEKSANPPEVIRRRMALLKPLRAAGKPVLAVEYLDDPALIEIARMAMRDAGYVVHFADRDLGRLRAGDLPDAQPTPASRRKARRWWFW
jgi:cysteinyl-tRNA synthetase